MSNVIRLLAVAVFMISAPAFAQGEPGQAKPHQAAQGKHHTDAQMAKLHKMMPKYAKAQARINAALGKGDLKAIAKETAYLLSTTADLKKSKPHRHHADQAEFRRLAASFEQDVKSTAELAGKGDREGAKAAFANAQKSCDACHLKFRDLP